MASRREGSKDTIISAIGVVVEWVSASLPIYEDTKLVLNKNIKLKWQEVNNAFAGTFGKDLKDFQVNVNIHKSDLYWIACRYPMLPCMDMIHWIVSHIDPETMTLRTVSGMEISTFREQDYDKMYQMTEPITIMETPFILPSSNANSRDILKNWVKELAKFRMTPNHIYKTKILWKSYQYLVIFSCRLYGKESTKTFPKSWVITLDQLAREGKVCN